MEADTVRTREFLSLGLTLGSALALTYVLCVGFGLVGPESLRMYEAWELWLPGFRWLSVGSFFLGLVESFLYGIYAAALLVPLYSFFSRRMGGSE
jgi:hypothetical protein